jgi:hypothetical protein
MATLDNTAGRKRIEGDLVMSTIVGHIAVPIAEQKYNKGPKAVATFIL